MFLVVPAGSVSGGPSSVPLRRCDPGCYSFLKVSRNSKFKRNKYNLDMKTFCF